MGLNQKQKRLLKLLSPIFGVFSNACLSCLMEFKYGRVLDSLCPNSEENNHNFSCTLMSLGVKVGGNTILERNVLALRLHSDSKVGDDCYFKRQL